MTAPPGVVLTVPFENPRRWWPDLSSRGRVSAGPGQGTHHDALLHAVDFALPSGTPVLAAASGQVVAVEDGFPDNGALERHRCYEANYVAVWHAPQTFSRYYHLQQGSVCVRPGQSVARGQQLASSGHSGYSSGPHLHFDVVPFLPRCMASIHAVPPDNQPSPPMDLPLPHMACCPAAFSAFLQPGSVGTPRPFTVVDGPPEAGSIEPGCVAVVRRGSGTFACIVQACEAAGAAAAVVVNGSEEPAPLFSMFGMVHQAAIPAVMVAAGAGRWLSANPDARLVIGGSARFTSSRPLALLRSHIRHARAQLCRRRPRPAARSTTRPPPARARRTLPAPLPSSCGGWPRTSTRFA